MPSRPLSSDVAVRTGHAPLWLAAVAIALLWAGFAAWALSLRADHRANLEQVLAGQRNAIGEHVAGIFRTTEVFLAAADRWIAAHPERDPRVDADFAALAAEFRRVTNQSMLVRLAEADGALHLVPAVPGARAANIADRDYFVAALAAAPGAVTIGAPFQGRATGRWAVAVATRLSQPSHGVTVVFVAVELSVFDSAFERVRLGADGSVSLVRRDGVLLARSATNPGELGKDLSSSVVFTEGLARQNEGVIFTEGRLTDAVPKLIAYTALEKYPLVVTVGRAMRGVAQELRGTLWLVAAVLALASLLVAAVARQFMLIRRQSGQAEQSARTIRESERHLRTVIDLVPHFIFAKDYAGRFVLANRAIAEAYGTTPEAMVGKSDGDFCPDAAQVARFLAADREVIESGKERLIPEETITDAAGCARTLRTTKIPYRAVDAAAPCVLGVSIDITASKRAAAQINELAFFDQLTGLANRTLLMDRLRQAQAFSARTGGHGALLFVDLDHFKAINDTRGHDVGDALLKEAATRLRRCVRDEDTIARVGSDEFVVVLSGLGAEPRVAAGAAETISGKILAALGEPYALDATPLRGSASIGVALFMGQTATLDALLKQADIAMYRAKEMGRATTCFFDPDMEASVKARAELELDLRQAIEARQFVLHYQPQVLSDGRVVGAEALVRWSHPRRGMVPPNDFIPLAEQTGLIVPLGLLVLEAACARLAEWARRPGMEDLSVAVNVSSRQLRQPDFTEQVFAVLRRTGANPHRLKLELTESLMVSGIEETIEKMYALKAKGIGFSLDDFGTGYSSLAYLKLLPLDQLKIDQSFVRDVLVDSNDAAIARTVVALGRSLGLSVIAEGVETEAQREFLEHNGCHAFQGYLFARPLPVEEFERFAR